MSSEEKNLIDLFCSIKGNKLLPKYSLGIPIQFLFILMFLIIWYLNNLIFIMKTDTNSRHTNIIP